jgi:integrase
MKECSGQARANTLGDQIKKLPAGGNFLTLMKVRPSGALQARRARNGTVTFYWRYTFEDQTERVAIGPYSSRTPPKSLTPIAGEFSIAAAENAARCLALEHVQAKPDGGLKQKRETEAAAQKQVQLAMQKAAAAAESAAKAELEAADARKRFSLGALCDEYVKYLKAKEKPSAYDAANIFKNHLTERKPWLAALPACDVTVEPVTDLLRELNEEGIGRTANKLRSYLGSAFNHGLRARFDPSLPLAFKGFRITQNPVMSTFRVKGADASAKNPLSVAELRTYFKAIEKLEGIQRATLRLHLFTGGQRIAQLLRLTRKDDLGDRIRLLDTKGKREHAREHYVPLLPQARADLDLLRQANGAEFIFSTTKGKKPINPMTLTNWAAKAAHAAGLARFDAKRIRSGVETLLASKRVSSDVRAQLQSHGLGGVQHRHYDGHDYHDEKLNALQLLSVALMESTSCNVVPISDFRAAA